MVGIKLLAVDWDENAWADEKLASKLIDSVVSMDSILWEDIVKFLNKHETSQISILLSLDDYKQSDVDAEFWIYDGKKSEIACEFVFFQEPQNPGITLFLNNPMKNHANL